MSFLRPRCAGRIPKIPLNVSDSESEPQNVRRTVYAQGIQKRSQTPKEKPTSLNFSNECGQDVSINLKPSKGKTFKGKKEVDIEYVKLDFNSVRGSTSTDLTLREAARLGTLLRNYVKINGSKSDYTKK